MSGRSWSMAASMLATTVAMSRRADSLLCSTSKSLSRLIVKIVDAPKPTMSTTTINTVIFAVSRILNTPPSVAHAAADKGPSASLARAAHALNVQQVRLGQRGPRRLASGPFSPPAPAAPGGQLHQRTVGSAVRFANGARVTERAAPGARGHFRRSRSLRRWALLSGRLTIPDDPRESGAEKGPDARRRGRALPEAYSLYVEGMRAPSPTKQMGPYRQPPPPSNTGGATDPVGLAQNALDELACGVAGKEVWKETSRGIL